MPFQTKHTQLSFDLLKEGKRGSKEIMSRPRRNLKTSALFMAILSSPQNSPPGTSSLPPSITCRSTVMTATGTDNVSSHRHPNPNLLRHHVGLILFTVCRRTMSRQRHIRHLPPIQPGLARQTGGVSGSREVLTEFGEPIG